MRNITLLLCLGLPLAAQSIPATLAGSGYRTPPSAIEAAPGQVLIVSLNGAQTRVPNPVFGTFDPVTGMSAAVAGFSAQLVQSRGRTPVGIYGAGQTPCATPSIPCVPATNITLIVPFALVDTANANGFASLEVKEGNNILANIAVRAVSDKVHVITSCDDSLSTTASSVKRISPIARPPRSVRAED